MRGSARSKKVWGAAGVTGVLALALAGTVTAPLSSATSISAPSATAAVSAAQPRAAAAEVSTTSAQPVVRRVAAQRLRRARVPSLRVRPRARRVVLSGRTRARSARLVVQRARPGSSRWVRVKQVRSRKRAYRASVGRLNRPMRYRVVNRKRARRSFVRLVPGPVRMSTPSDACGVRPRKPDGSLWACTFVDHFSGTELDRDKWVPQTRGYLTGVKSRRFACYTEDNVTVADGRLRLRLHKRAKLFECPGFLQNLTTRYTAGSVTTYHRFSQRYGRFEARMRNTAANVPGLHEAFWLWPDDREVAINWPWSGEIDVAETYSAYPHLAIPFLHYANPESTPLKPGVLTGPHTNTAYHCSAERGTWNTYRLEWAPDRIRIFVNDRLCLTNTSGDAAFQEKFILAFTQAIGSEGNEATPDTPIPAFTEVDWVRVWR